MFWLRPRSDPILQLILVDRTIKLKVCLLNRLEDLVVVVAIEWRIAAKKDVEHDSCRPYVTLFVVVL